MDNASHARAQRQYILLHPEARKRQYAITKRWKETMAYDKFWAQAHPGFRSYTNMIARCYYKNHKSYKYYGQRGIGVCANWRHSFKQFYRDMGPRPVGLTLDRIDRAKDYSFENCKWSTMKEQNAPNRRLYK